MIYKRLGTKKMISKKFMNQEKTIPTISDGSFIVKDYNITQKLLRKYKPIKSIRIINQSKKVA
tara:strand:+ start:202 stop:390 length:189 start_codon:yes stop_codon:yes gene_type:complete